MCGKVADETFPCTFGTTAFEAGEIRFAFVDPADAASVPRELSRTLAEYAAFIATQSPVRASMQPLAIFMREPPGCRTLRDYYRTSWRLLEEVHRLDPSPWPRRIPRDPDTPDWSFCFGGVPFFINFKTPLHRRRRSRRTSHAYVWLVQARDGFDIVAGDTPRGRNARRIIRKKLAAYDDVPVYRELRHYGSPENREWKQYFVPEDDRRLDGACPFSPRDADPGTTASCPDADETTVEE